MDSWVGPLIEYARVEHHQFDIWEDLQFILLAAFPDRRVFRLPESQEQINAALTAALPDEDRAVLARAEAIAKRPSKDPTIVEMRARRDKIKRKLRYQLTQLEMKLYGARLSDVVASTATTTSVVSSAASAAAAVVAEKCSLCADLEATITTACCKKTLLCNLCYCNVIIQRFGTFVCPFCRNEEQMVTVPNRVEKGSDDIGDEQYFDLDGEYEEDEEVEVLPPRQSIEDAQASRAARAIRRSSARDSGASDAVPLANAAVNVDTTDDADVEYVPGAAEGTPRRHGRYAKMRSSTEKVAADDPDYYGTHPRYTNALLPPLALCFDKDCAILEPCHGRGLITNVLRDAGYTNITIRDLFFLDKEGNAVEYVAGDEPEGYDMLTDPLPTFDLLITNPPYCHKYDILRVCCASGKPFALLLPSCMFNTRRWHAVIDEYKPRVHLVIPGFKNGFLKPCGREVDVGAVCWVCCNFPEPRVDKVYASVEFV